jgi:hypothetical protein
MTAPLKWWQIAWPLAVAAGVSAANPWIYPREPEQPAAWAPLLLCFGLVLAGRLSQGLLTGVVLALFVGYHPLFLDAAKQPSDALLAQVAVLGVLLACLTAVRLIPMPRVLWWAYLVLLACMAALVLAAIWLDRSAGLTAAAGCLAALTLAFPAPGGWRELARPARFNLVLAMSIGALAPAAALLLAWPLLGSQQAYSQAVLPPFQLPTWDAWSQHVATFMKQAFLLPWWITTAVLLYAGWRVLRRGLRTKRQGKPPAAWPIGVFSFLSLLVGLTLATKDTRPAVTLVPWCALLFVFLLFDLLQGIGERLVLQPPETKKA